MKDSELIRAEIERTSRRIEQTLETVARRTRRTGRAAIGWAVVTAATGAVVAGAVGVYVWRRRIFRRRHDVAAPSGNRALPFDSVRIARDAAQSRSSR